MPAISSKLIQALIERLAPSARQARPTSPNPSRTFEAGGKTITPPQTPDAPVPSPGVFPEDITKSLEELTPEELLDVLQDLPNPTITRHAPGAVDTSTPLPTSDTIPEAVKWAVPSEGLPQPSPVSGRIPGPPRSSKGPGPSSLSSSSGVRFDPLEESVRGKFSTDRLEEITNEILEANPTIRAEEVAPIAEKQLAKELDLASPKRSFQGETIGKREQVREGRKSAIVRGEQKFMPRGNRADRSEPPNVFGEEDLGTQAIKESIDEATGQRTSGVKGQSQKKFGSIEQPGAKDTLENLFVDEQTKLVQAIQDELDTDVVLQTLSPKLQREAAEAMIDQAGLFKQADTTISKPLFKQIDELDAALQGKDTSGFKSTFKTTPEAFSETDDLIIGFSQKQLTEFKAVAAKVSAAARVANDTTNLGREVPMGRVIKMIEKFPEDIKVILRKMVKDGTPIPEALVRLQDQLLDRLNAPLRGTQ